MSTAWLVSTRWDVVGVHLRWSRRPHPSRKMRHRWSTGRFPGCASEVDSTSLGFLFSTCMYSSTLHSAHPTAAVGTDTPTDSRWIKLRHKRELHLTWELRYALSRVEPAEGSQASAAAATSESAALSVSCAEADADRRTRRWEAGLAAFSPSIGIWHAVLARGGQRADCTPSRPRVPDHSSRPQSTASSCMILICSTWISLLAASSSELAVAMLVLTSLSNTAKLCSSCFSSVSSKRSRVPRGCCVSAPSAAWCFQLLANLRNSHSSLGTGRCDVGVPCKWLPLLAHSSAPSARGWK